MVHGGTPVINDIDIYKEVKEKQQINVGDGSIQTRKVNDWYPATYINEDGLEIVDDSYGRIFVAENGARMRVFRHCRKNIFNIIEFLYEDYRNHNQKVKTRDMVVLEGFDLNCCKAGINLDTKQIIYTTEFVEFLETKQLKVVNPCAPVHSTIRLYKKMKDIDCFCNVEHEMRFLTVAAKHIQGGQMSKYIGPETYSKYLKMKEFVDKYFTLREPQSSDEIPHSLKEIYYIGNKRNPEVNIWLFDPVMDFDIVEEASTMNRLKRIWNLLYTFKKGSEQDKINKIFYKNAFLNTVSTEDQWDRTDYNSKDENGHYIKLPYYNSSRYTFNMLLSKKDYHKCNFDIKHVDYIDKFAKEHYHIQMFLRGCNTLMEQYELIRFIKSLVNKEGSWVIGALENSHSFMVTHRDEQGRLLANILGKEVILKIVDKYKKENSGFLTEAVDLSGFEYNECVKEIVTKIGLTSEGERMGHCVGGYSQSIIDGRSRIFHIECDGIGSTIEIGLPVKTYMTSRYPDPLSFRHYDGYPNDIVEIYQDDECEEDECIVVTGNQENQHLKPLERHKIKIHNNLFYTIRQHYGRYPEKGNLTPTDINKDIATELVRYLNMNYLPKNYKIRSEFFANKEDKRIFV